MATTVTVPSGSSTPISLSYANSATASLATALLSSVYTAAFKGTPIVTYPTALSSVSGSINEFVIAAGTTAVTIPAGYDTILDLATGVVSVTGNNDRNEMIVAGDSASLFFAAGTGTGTIVGGTGASTVFGSGFTTEGDASYTVALAAGAATAPSTTNVTGTGNVVFGGSGFSAITVGGGANTIVGGSGSTTINASGSGGLIFGGGGTSSLTFTGTGADTLASAGGFVLAFATGTGSSLYVTAGGNMEIVNSAAANSSIFATAGATFAYAGPGGSLTLVGNSGGNALVAAGGNETLNAAFNSGNNILVAGSGNDVVFMGNTGSDAVFAGSGNATMVGGGSTAADLFAFTSGSTGGVDTIVNWTSNDTLVLIGYGLAAEKAAVASQTASNGGISITLPDKTVINIFSASSTPVVNATTGTYFG